MPKKPKKDYIPPAPLKSRKPPTHGDDPIKNGQYRAMLKDAGKR